MSPLARRSRRRLIWSGTVAAAVVASALTIPTSGAGTGQVSLAQAQENRKAALGLPHQDPPGTPPHNHNDPATKNLVSRAGESGRLTKDPTTAAERAAAAAYVEAERRRPDPQLRAVPVVQRTDVPQTRYAMANGCYRLAGDPIYFKPTTLGVYLLYDKSRRYVVAGGQRAATPSAATEWTARKVGNRFTFTNRGKKLSIRGSSRFALTMADGCRQFPESEINIHGQPFAGVTPYQEVRGYVDGHTHGMAFEFLGGRVHCGKPWDRYGITYALQDCPDHTRTGGYGAILETFFSGGLGHDPVGWPTFKDWPAPNSLTHEGTYYRWLERSWRGGQRLFVNLLVENNKLCQVYPLKRNSCDDMDSIRLQARDMYRMQDYIDAQAGGPGKGFYRIVRDPFEARRVINAGKMAVVMGIETSIPFGCTVKFGRPKCDAADINRQLDEVHRMGVRQMELVNKFDNALSGVAGDQGEVGAVVNGANFLETGSFWDMRHCAPKDGESHDNNQVALPDIGAGQQDALFGAIGELFGALGSAVLPLYPPPDHCNSRGLTSLGQYTIRGLAKRNMIFDPDHMSVKGRRAAMNLVEKLDYPGVISSHSWATPDAYPRIYRAGGFITPYAGDSTGFVQKWRRHIGWADKRYYWGIGYGADINGLGAQGDPRGAKVRNKVTYPFRGLGGVRIDRQRTGKRVFDINKDGVAQYGLYPDWIQDLTKVAGRDGRKIADDMARGAEAYLQMWERAVGIQADSCRNPGLRQPVATIHRLVRPGMTPVQVMRKVGQPFSRLGTTYGICGTRGSDHNVKVTIRFGGNGRVSEVTPR